MPVEGEGSVTHWIGHLKAGDPLTAHHLCERYFGRMVGLARRRIQAARPLGATEDEEDAALSAFESLCLGAARGKFDRLDDRSDLWQLLVVITTRKVVDQVKRRCRQKRDSRRWTRSVTPSLFPRRSSSPACRATPRRSA